MAYTIERAAVIGAGVMGAAIAAHLANVGKPTYLLDIVPPKLGDDDKAKGWDETSPAFRNKFANAGLKNAIKARPAAFYDAADAELITPGNLEDNLDWLGECDLIIEAVVERLDIKQSLFEKVEAAMKPGAIAATNTSGLSVAAMTEGRSEAFQEHFIGLHFFNPPRYLKLLEVIAGPKTKPEVVEAMSDFCEKTLGKEVTPAKDTPNFIANRIGIFGIMKLFHGLSESGLSIEEIDALTGPVIGRAKSATFRTADLVGLDVVAHTARTIYDNCPDDENHGVFAPPEFIKQMLAQGKLGDKTKGGFYKKSKDDKGKRVILTLDLETMDYRPKAKARLDSVAAARQVDDPAQRIKMLAWGKDKAGEFLWSAFKSTLIYAATRLGEIADSVLDIDQAMRNGFAWELGPFQTWDALGLEKSVARMEAEGEAVPGWVKDMVTAGFKSFYKTEAGSDYYYDPQTKDYVEAPQKPEIILLKSLKERDKVVAGNKGATLYDLGDGIAGLEFHTKMNSLGLEIGAMMRTAKQKVMADFDGLVIANHAPNFSVGANLGLVLFTAQEEEWDELDFMVRGLQYAVQELKLMPKPVVAAPAGMALGGGCEVCLGADKIHANAETYIGLVEVGVGVIPAGGGCKELLIRATENVFDIEKGGVWAKQIDLSPFIARVFQHIATAKVATSAKEAKKLGFLRSTDRITTNRSHLIYNAKKTCQAMVMDGYEPPKVKKMRALGTDGAALLKYAAFNMAQAGMATEYEVKIAQKLAHVLTGGNVLADSLVTEDDIMDLEREAFLSLCGEPKTQARMAHTLKTGKPLRN